MSAVERMTEEEIKESFATARIPPLGKVTMMTEEEIAQDIEKLGKSSWFTRMLFAGIMLFTKGPIYKIFTAIISVVWMWSFNALVKASPGRAKWIARQVTEQFFRTDPVWAEFVAGYMNTMLKTKVSVGDMSGMSLKQMSDHVSGPFSRDLLESMLGLILPSVEETKADPLKGAERFLSTNLQFQMDAWMLHLLGDMQSFGIFKSLKDLPNAISWAFGVGWLSWLVMGTPFRAGINVPMERYFNRIYRPTTLTIAQLIDARQKGLIDWDKYNEEMASAGYSPELTVMLWDLSRKEFSRADLKEMWSRRIITEEEIKKELERQGYNFGLQDIILRLITEDKFYSLRDDIATKAISLYSQQVLSKNDLDSYLEAAQWNQREKELGELKGRLGQLDQKFIPDSDVPKLYELRQITWLSAIDMLKSRGYSDRDAEWYLKVRVDKEKWFAI